MSFVNPNQISSETSASTSDSESQSFQVPDVVSSPPSPRHQIQRPQKKGRLFIINKPQSHTFSTPSSTSLTHSTDSTSPHSQASTPESQSIRPHSPVLPRSLPGTSPSYSSSLEATPPGPKRIILVRSHSSEHSSIKQKSENDGYWGDSNATFYSNEMNRLPLSKPTLIETEDPHVRDSKFWSKQQYTNQQIVPSYPKTSKNVEHPPSESHPDID